MKTTVLDVVLDTKLYKFNNYLINFQCYVKAEGVSWNNAKTKSIQSCIVSSVTDAIHPFFVVSVVELRSHL